MTPRQLKAWRLRLDLSQEGLARWLGVSRVTVNRWEGGLQPIPKVVGLLEREHTANQPDDSDDPLSPFNTDAERDSRALDRHLGTLAPKGWEPKR